MDDATANTASTEIASTNVSRDADTVSRAANLLNRAVELLNGRSNVSQEERTISDREETVSGRRTAAGDEHWRTRATANFQRIFGGLQPRSQEQRAGGRGGRTGSRNTGKGAKQVFNPASGQWFWKRETWTHKFYCFPNKNQDCPENREEREISRRAGLGEKKITFRKDASASEVVTELEEAYPKLKQGGGFELLRSGKRMKDLVLITSPPGGYSVPFLKNSGLGQSTIYVRPIQMDLNTEPVIARHSDELPSEPTVKCLNCQREVAMSFLRDHHDKCSGGSSSNNEQLQDDTSNLRDGDIRKYTCVASESSEDSDSDPLNKCDVQRSVQQSIDEAEVSILQEVFPKLPLQKLQTALTVYKTADETASFLLREEQVDTVCGTDVKRLKLPPNPEDVLKIWRESTIDTKAKREIINIDRNCPRLFRSLFSKYKRADMNLKARIEVEFDGEAGVDAGSLTREYFNILMGLLRRGDKSNMPSLFEGQEDHIVPVHSVDALSSGCFYIAGQMIAHSLLNGGVGFVGMSRAVAMYIAANGNDAEEASVLLSTDDVPDLDTRNVLIQIRNAESEVEFRDLNSSDTVSRLMLASGVNMLLSPDTKSVAYQDLLLHEVLLMRHHEVADIAKGMQSLALTSYLKMNDGLLALVFPSLADMCVTSEEMKAKIRLHWDFSQTVLSDQEKQARDYLLHYLDHGIKKSSEEGVTMDLFLKFIQGCPGPLQDRTLRLKFHKTAKETFPSVDACFVVLTLPICHESYASFEETMSKAIRFGCQGYGKV